MDFDPEEIAYAPTTGVRRVHETPLVAASDRSLEGYGCLVDVPEGFPIEIVRWPAQGWRPIDANSGDQGGVAEGVFETGGKARPSMLATTPSGTAISLGGATGPKKQLPAVL
jgi:hypothetical protein